MSPIAVIDAAVAELVSLLSAYRPSPVSGLPAPTLSLTQVADRPVGIGGRRGTRTAGVLGAAELGAVRIEALARYQLWSGNLGGLDGALSSLIGALLADQQTLRAQGLLRMRLAGASTVDPGPSAGTWGRQADVAVLFEYTYEITDESLGLIARILVSTDREAPGTAREVTTLTDAMTRWDDSAAPDLLVRGPTLISRLSLLARLADATATAPVRLLRTVDGAPAPVESPTFVAFLAAVAGTSAPLPTGQVVFDDFAAFQAVMASDGAPLELGDPPTPYLPVSVALDPPIVLPTARDRFEIACAAGALDPPDVAYLSAR